MQRVQFDLRLTLQDKYLLIFDKSINRELSG